MPVNPEDAKHNNDPKASLEATEFLMTTHDLAFVDAAGEAPKVAALVRTYDNWRTETGRIPIVRVDEPQRSRLTNRHAPARRADELPFGRPGGAQYHGFDEPIGHYYTQALNDPEDTLIREVEDEVVRRWRGYALWFTFVALIVGILRVIVDQLDIYWLDPWLVDLVIGAVAVLACATGFSSYLVRKITSEIRERLETRRACIIAAAFRRTLDGEPMSTIGGQPD